MNSDKNPPPSPKPLLLLLIATLSVAAVIGVGVAAVGAGSSSNIAAPATSTADPAPRIAALLPFAADQLIALGHDPIAVPLLRGPQPEPWGDLPRIAVDHSAGPNLEQLIAADPDIVIISSVYTQFVPQFESELGARVVVMDIETPDDIPAHIETLGELTGRGETAAELSRQASAMIEVEATNTEGPRTLAVFGTPHAFYAFLPDSYLGELIEINGGQLITADMAEHPVFNGLAPLSMEAVIDRDPELLLVIFHGEEDSARAMLDRDPLWNQITAVREGRVAFLADDLYAMRPGSRFGEALTEIRAIVSGERFTHP